jgi:required for meiotic nuclear division protein 1
MNWRMDDTRALALRVHTFHAVAFAENLSLRELASLYPEAKRSTHELCITRDDGSEMFVYPFGALLFRNVPAAAREAEVVRLRAAQPKLSTTVIKEEFTVRVDSTGAPRVEHGVLILDAMSAERSSVIAMTVAQSAAMEYYEGIVEEMFERTDRLVERMEARGTVPFGTRPLHRFIGAAIGVRNEVLSVLHLLDKPDETWVDAGIDRIYEELRSEFDLADRYQSLELKLRSIQEALELVLDVARDRRLVLLELAIVLLIVFEIVLAMAER